MTDTNSAPAATSIPQFCLDHDISEPFYYELKKRNLGPKEMRLGANVVRITREAAAEWRKARETPTEEEAAAQARNADALRERARHAARQAIKSPLHVSQRGTAR